MRANAIPGQWKIRVTVSYEGATAVVAISQVNEGPADPQMVGILHVTSEPDKAQVYLDGALTGETPLTLESVTAGEHRLRVSKRFYETVEVAERVEPVRVTRRAVRLARAPATLIVRSDLGGGELLVDGKVVGALQPLQKLPLEAGPHRVAVRHPQAGTIAQDIEVEGSSQIVEFTRAGLGSLTILSDVPLLRLTVQGRAVDPPPVTVENLPAGEVLIGGTAAGGSIRKRAAVKPGATVLVRIEASDVRSSAMEHRGVRFEFVPIEPGEFLMGSESGGSDEKPVHRVRISRPFEMGKFEVTQAQWEAVMGNNPSNFKGADRPVETVSWNDVQEFLKRLNARQDGYRYRLPTEAEWEYAARAGSREDRYGELDSIGWYQGNSGGQTHPVGQKQPNAWGLYDMLGDVWEWCQDWYASYAAGEAIDPQGPPSGQQRVLRGGSWGDDARSLRAPFRDSNGPVGRYVIIGFRCVREQK